MKLEFEKIRQSDCAMTIGRRDFGAVGLGAPIHEDSGEILGDLAFNLPEQRFVSTIKSWMVNLLIKHARRIPPPISKRCSDRDNPAGEVAARRPDRDGEAETLG